MVHTELIIYTYIYTSVVPHISCAVDVVGCLAYSIFLVSFNHWVSGFGSDLASDFVWLILLHSPTYVRRLVLSWNVLKLNPFPV